MGANNRNRGPRTCIWRAWCHGCLRHLSMVGRQGEWPDQVRCPLCGKWCKVAAKGTTPLKGDVVCPFGSGRNRVEKP